ncbi:MAG: lysine 2,3-aminomutase, partial [Acidobacteriota bacterium]|nr:lysine 2,3-aminomutase [Acidobacteriota bacterium]
RLHTRAPIHQPDRITGDLAAWLGGARPGPVWTVIHATHPRELRETSDRAFRTLMRHGVPLLAQSVLLAGVNDDAAVLAELFGGLYERGVKPYYLHHPDRVAGTRRFRLPIARGLQIVRRLREALPGPAMPTYVLDPPDGGGKVPVSWLEPVGPGRWRVPRPGGRETYYEDEAEGREEGR